MLDVLRELPVEQIDGESDESFIKRLGEQEKSRRWASEAAAPYTHARLASVETKQNKDQFAEEQQAKNKDMDVLEIARRIAFVLAEADRMQPSTQDAPESRAH